MTALHHSGNNNAWPDFYIVGAAKSGTTSMWNYLAQHPDIWLGRIKEPNFFAMGPSGPNVIGPASEDELLQKLHRDSITQSAEYLALFSGAGPDQITGEASVRYLYNADAPGRIAEVRPDARIIMILRDPIERLRSHYAMNRAAGLEPLELREALEAEDARIEKGWGWDWHYVNVGLYSGQVQRYLDAFDREQILVLRHDELRSDPVGAVRRVCRHIGASEDFLPETSMRSKTAYVPRSRLLDALRRTDSPARRALTAVLPTRATEVAGRWLRQVNHETVPLLDGPLLYELHERFGADAELLDDLLESSGVL